MRTLSVISLAVICGCSKAPTMARYRPVSHWVAALQDSDPRNRKQAVIVLGNVGTADPAAVPALALAVGDRDKEVRRQALLALLKLGPAASPALSAVKEATKDPDPKISALAIKARERIQLQGW
jgi:HEAT repeat protein